MIKTEDIKKLNYKLSGDNENHKKELDGMYGNTDRPKEPIGRVLLWNDTPECLLSVANELARKLNEIIEELNDRRT